MGQASCCSKQDDKMEAAASSEVLPAADTTVLALEVLSEPPTEQVADKEEVHKEEKIEEPNEAPETLGPKTDEVEAVTVCDNDTTVEKPEEEVKEVVKDVPEEKTVEAQEPEKDEKALEEPPKEEAAEKNAEEPAKQSEAQEPPAKKATGSETKDVKKSSGHPPKKRKDEDAAKKKKESEAKKKADEEAKKKAEEEAKQKEKEAESNPEAELLTAAVAGNDKAIQKLLKGGVNINAVDAEGKTALHLAAEKGYEEIVGRLSTAKKVKVNLKTTTTKETPLHFACREGHKDCAVMIVRGGAEVKAKNKAGQMAADLAQDQQLKNWLALADPGRTPPPWQGQKMR